MNILPNYNQPLVEKGLTARTWYQFFQSMWKGFPTGAEVSVTATASPMTYLAPSKGFLIVNGGTVSLVQFTRDQKTNYTTGQTQGCFPVSNGDALIVTYSVTPTLTFVPQ